MPEAFSSKRSRISPLTYFAILLVGSSLVGGALFLIHSSMNVPPPLPMGQITQTVNPMSQNLKFVAKVNSSIEAPGSAFNVTIDETNMAAAAINLPYSAKWGVSAFTALTPCPIDRKGPLLVAVYPGHYGLGNISNGLALQIFPPTSPHCPPSYNYFDFSPSSDVITAYSNSTQGLVANANYGTMSMSMDIQGYYNPNNTNYNNATNFSPITPFAKGNYTFVEGDEWGSVAFLYLEVS